MTDLTNQTFADFLQTRFSGVLSSGSHKPDGVACALEAVSIFKELAWTDSPSIVGLPDLRPINDGPWSSDAERTENMVPLIESLLGWDSWEKAKQVAWAKRITERTIREILPIVLRTADTANLEKAATQCEKEGTAEVARAAADAAAYAAAYAADAANATEVLKLACKIWREEADRA